LSRTESSGNELFLDLKKVFQVVGTIFKKIFELNLMTKISKIRTVPHLVRKEIVALLAGCAVLILFSAFFDAPMGGMANPSGVPVENVKAPWIFVGIQEMLKTLSPELAGLIIPLVTFLLVSAIPFLRMRRSLEFMMFALILGMASMLTLWGYVI